MGRSGRTAIPLRRNIGWTLGGNLIYAACQWAMLAALAKTGSPGQVGTLALALGITAPIVMLANLQLRAIQATDARQQFRFGHYLAVRLVTTALALAVCGAAALMVRRASQDVWVIVWVAVAKGAESLSDLLYGHLQFREEMRTIALSMMLRGGISLTVFVAALLCGAALWAACAAMAAVWAGMLLVFDVSSVRAFGGVHAEWEWPRLIALCRRALPLGGVMALVSLQANLPRYLIEGHLGSSSLGIYSALASIPLAVTTVINAVGQAAAPRLGKLHARGQFGDFRRLIFKLVGVGLALGTAGWLVSRLLGARLLAFLFRAEYAAAHALLPAIMAASALGFVGSFLGYGLTAAGRFRPQVPLVSVSVAVTAVVGWWLTPRWGLYGVVVGTGAGNAILLLLSAVTLSATLHKQGSLP